MRYFVQVNTTDPDKWQTVNAVSLRDACIAGAQGHGETLRRDGSIVVFVAPEKCPKHANGAPMIAHAFDLQIAAGTLKVDSK